MKPSSDNHSKSDRAWLFLWLLIVLLCVTYCTQKILSNDAFYSNLTALLPVDNNTNFQLLNDQFSAKYENRALILLQDIDSETAQLASKFEQSLVEVNGVEGDNSNVEWQQSLINIYSDHSQLLLNETTRHWLSNNSSEAIAQDILSDLLSPIGNVRLQDFTQDPANLLGRWSLGLQPASSLFEKNGRMALSDESKDWLLISVMLSGSPYNPVLQEAMTEVVQDFKHQHPNVPLLTSGLIFHAAEGTRLAKFEISTVGVGSLLGIILLVVLAFRSVVPFVLVSLVLSSSCLLALTASFLVFDKIHMITLAFGSTLLGVAVDYLFHFLIKAHAYNNGSKARRHIAMALMVGALSSVTAYLMQLYAPFPGLRQMAVFSAFGLLGAWFSVLVLAPFYSPKTQNSLLVKTFFDVFVMPLYQRDLFKGKAFLVGCLMLLALSVTMVLLGNSKDDLSSLNTSSDALLASETRVQSLFKQTSNTQYFVVEASSHESLLYTLEQLESQLIKEEVKFPKGYQKFLATSKQQESDSVLVDEKIWQHDGALRIVAEKLGLDYLSLTQNRSEQAIFDMAKVSTSDMNALLMPPMSYTNNHIQVLQSLYSGYGDDIYEKIAGQFEGVYYVNKVRNISSMLSQYRQEFSVALLITISLLIVCLSCKYRGQTWRIALPLILALSVALAAASIEGITLFHMMALLLVIGIGIDTAVFYKEVGFTSESWLAASLSSMTSVLAFGLLSLSQVPILHQFGLVILLGILVCWLITPCFFASVKKITVPGEFYDHEQ